MAVHYADEQSAGALLTGPAGILGVVGFGAERPGFLPAGCPFIAAPLQPAAGASVFEIWTASAPCRPVAFGGVTGAHNGDLVFGVITLAQTATESFEAAVETAYLGIFDFLDAAGFAAPLRFWNYLTDITKDDDGLERYRRFNIGRHRAFQARLRQPQPPAASCVGGRHGASIIYFLAAHEPARTLENRRQVSAYAYPPRYGPRSPSFSRASLHALDQGSSLFISGTASITGHASRHAGDLRGQTAETIRNLQTLRVAAERLAPGSDEPWALKVYLDEPSGRETVAHALDAAFGPRARCLYLRGDMCRPELLVEIEAFRHAGLAGRA